MEIEQEIHVTPLRTYVLVYLTLLALLTISVVVAFLHLGVMAILVPMLVAVLKASLVIAIFMHVRGSSPTTKLFVGAGFVWLAILIGLTMADYLTRLWM